MCIRDRYRGDPGGGVRRGPPPGSARDPSGPRLAVGGDPVPGSRDPGRPREVGSGGSRPGLRRCPRPVFRAGHHRQPSQDMRFFSVNFRRKKSGSGMTSFALNVHQPQAESFRARSAWHACCEKQVCAALTVRYIPSPYRCDCFHVSLREFPVCEISRASSCESARGRGHDCFCSGALFASRSSFRIFRRRCEPACRPDHELRQHEGWADDSRT